MHRRTITLILLLTLVCFRLAFSQGTDSGKISLSERAWMASKIYSSVQTYFAHWQGAPNLDLDAAYKKYLEQALASDDRMSFDLASMEFFAELRNGHSGFNDRWLSQTYGQPLGFQLTRIEDKWVVTRTRTDKLSVGDVVRSVDSVAMDAFYEQKKKYIAASSEQARQRKLFYSPYLFPQTFVLTLEDGKAVRIERREQKLNPVAPRIIEGRMIEPDIAYLRIPSFEVLADERKAVEFVKQHAGAKCFIIDVRGNGGGTTPSELIRALMDRPYREVSEAGPVAIGLFGAYRQILRTFPPEQFSERDRGSFESLGAYANPQLLTPGELKMPEKPLYTGRVLILIDNECASACEDFVIPFKVSGRGQLIGQATTGSTGQPFMLDFGNGMTFRVSAKRVFFPDGSTFEGVGVTPDISLQPSLKDIRSRTDIVLDKAIELARSTPGQTKNH